jgi:hypothetical protein
MREDARTNSPYCALENRISLLSFQDNLVPTKTVRIEVVMMTAAVKHPYSHIPRYHIHRTPKNAAAVFQLTFVVEVSNSFFRFR